MRSNDHHIWERLALINLDTHEATGGEGAFPLRQAEVWYQDPEDPNLWHGNAGVILNSAALAEREWYFDVARIPAPSPPGRPRDR